jgi:hypothetical protein
MRRVVKSGDWVTRIMGDVRGRFHFHNGRTFKVISVRGYSVTDNDGYFHAISSIRHATKEEIPVES